MSDEIERILVSDTEIIVHGQKERGICQCGHARAYHGGGISSCQERITRELNGNTYLLLCSCMHFVDRIPDPERQPRRGSWPWVMAAANLIGYTLCLWGVSSDAHGFNNATALTLKILGSIWTALSLGWFISHTKAKK
jgi:hypothetical protein